jgi:hypothetical protein
LFSTLSSNLSGAGGVAEQQLDGKADWRKVDHCLVYLCVIV